MVAIVGGSGAGKSWLAERLQRSFKASARRLSLDDFYLDRSHLPPARRASLNFDNPGAIDWDCFETALQKLASGKPARVPLYDFETHSRVPRNRIFKPKPILLVEGLWLLRRRSVRRF